jgi:tRNA threonylcarbamoyladenosine biosynthesis protein TsaB
LDRIAVGSGPGSFTGLRVGIAIAQGLSEGLEVPLVGIPSLRAMALAVPTDQDGCRCALVDARRGELFVAAYDPGGRERVEVRLVASVNDLTPILHQLRDPLFIGNGVASLPASTRVFRSAETDLPHARWTAIAAVQAPHAPSVRPLYVRDAGAVMPRLPQNPLGPSRSD